MTFLSAILKPSLQQEKEALDDLSTELELADEDETVLSANQFALKNHSSNEVS